MAVHCSGKIWLANSSLCDAKSCMLVTESMELPLWCFLHDIYFLKYVHIIFFLHDINLFFFGVPKIIWRITTMIESLKSIYLMHLKVFPELLVSRNIFWTISFSSRYHRYTWRRAAAIFWMQWSQSYCHLHWTHLHYTASSSRFVLQVYQVKSQQKILLEITHSGFSYHFIKIS